MKEHIARPGTLVEVIRRFEARVQTFGVALSEFLDEFYRDQSDVNRLARITGRPAITGDSVIDTYVGGVGEHLARRWRLGDPPAWTEAPERFLRRPWFPPGTNLEKAMLIKESPLAFRRRFIFIEAEPLRRVTMPRDKRWFALEARRLGLSVDELKTWFEDDDSPRTQP